jgi:hypothetical protein
MTRSLKRIRRSAMLLCLVALLALPAASFAMPAPESSYQSPPAATTVAPAPTSSSSSSSDDTLPIVLASCALGIALAGAAYSLRTGLVQRRAVSGS